MRRGKTLQGVGDALEYIRRGCGRKEGGRNQGLLLKGHGAAFVMGCNSGVGGMSQDAGALHFGARASRPLLDERAGRPRSGGEVLEAPCIVAIGPAAVIVPAASAKAVFRRVSGPGGPPNS